AGAYGLFHKGRDYRSEVAESAQRWSFDLVEHASATDAHGVILELSDLRQLT
ncbi:MAG: 16S rRNA (guanine(527)-N(7))-methyltransferase RsmG, partial [Mesorhizobium sp.]